VTRGAPGAGPGARPAPARVERAPAAGTPVRPALWLLLALAAGVASLASRSLWPIDETRYASVAWEMWLRKDLLVPHLGGAPYGDKPPLLFWLLNLGWAVAGVNAAWPRFIPFFFTLGAVILTARLARALWPGRPSVHGTAPLVLAGIPFWDLYGTFLLADMLLVVFVLTAMLGLWIAAVAGEAGGRGRGAGDWRSGRPHAGIGWLLFVVGIAGGALAKGPVILLHTLPPALLAPWWGRRVAEHARSGAGARAARHGLLRPGPAWYGALSVALLLGAGAALAWALPAAAAGGPVYRSEILWGQTAGRVLHSFAHGRPWWWYVPLAPILFFPWSVWPALWRSLVRLCRDGLDSGARLCLSWVVPTFVLLSAVSGKQPHYLLPLLPGLALLAGRALADPGPPRRPGGSTLPLTVLGLAGLAVAGLFRLWPAAVFGPAPFWAERVSPVWGLAVVAVALAGGLAVMRRPSAAAQARPLAVAGATALILIELGPARIASPAYDVTPLARHLAVLEGEGAAIANLGDDEGQFDFAGRLERAPEKIAAADVVGWVAAHPDGRVIVYYREWKPASAAPGGPRYGGGMKPSAPSGPERASADAVGSGGAPAVGPPRPEFAQAYRGHAAAVWPAAALRSHPELLEGLP
jgi:4-amino-4-deoxy-L-arabinose transferase-like glycosyltransferase